MRYLFLVAVLFAHTGLQAQSSLTSDLVEGGKTLVELIKVIRAPRVATAADINPPVGYIDSCGLKNLADIQFKNKTSVSVSVSLYFRIGNNYAEKPLLLTLAAFSQESLFELKAGIYKYKVETLVEEENITIHQGELRLNSCDRTIREIK